MTARSGFGRPIPMPMPIFRSSISSRSMRADARRRGLLRHDGGTDPTRREARAAAAATADQAMSGIVMLKQEIDTRRSQPGFLVFQAVRRKGSDGAPAVVGFAYAAFRA